MRLKELREAAHESQQSLAIEMNISQAMVSRYELEQASSDVTTLIHLANHYNVSVDYLIGRTDVKTMYTKSDLSESEQNILFMYKRLSNIQKGKAEAYIQGLLQE